MVQNDIRLSITTSFLESFEKLPKPIQKKTREFFKKYIENPQTSSINFEIIANVKNNNIRSVRIDLSYRGIILKPENGNNFYLLWVDHHDEAYAWAMSKNINENDIEGFEYSLYEPKKQSFNDVRKTRLANASISDLAKIGVPLEIIDDLRNINKIEDIEFFSDYFSVEILLKLKHYLNGYEMEEILRTNNIDKNNPFVITDDINEKELSNIIKDSLQSWRIFLHPEQLKLAHRDYIGSSKIIGAAGTGKTVIALHRVKYLQARLKNDEKLLFTTFTTTLANDLKDKIKLLFGGIVPTNIVINNIDSVIHDYISNNRMKRVIIYDSKPYWIELETSEFSSDFLKDEWEQVILPNHIDNLESYLKIARTNRYMRLDRRARVEIWNKIEGYITKFNAINAVDEEWAKQIVIDHMLKHNKKGLFRNIVVDETQDMSAMSLQFIRALAGEEKENDIFLVGDSRQRIYRNINTLKKQGINVVGNSFKVTLNYRTTDSILELAENLLGDQDFDDLDGNLLERSEIQSVMIGDTPTVNIFNSQDEEIGAIISHINELKSRGSEDSEICISLRTNQQVSEYNELLKNKGIKTFLLSKGQKDESTQQGVRISTMHRIKGLEFSHMILPSLDETHMPLKSLIEHYNNKDEIEYVKKLERSLLYVVITRARFTVYISAYNSLSKFID